MWIRTLRLRGAVTQPLSGAWRVRGGAGRRRGGAVLGRAARAPPPAQTQALGRGPCLPADSGGPLLLRGRVTRGQSVGLARGSPRLHPSAGEEASAHTVSGWVVGRPQWGNSQMSPAAPGGRWPQCWGWGSLGQSAGPREGMPGPFQECSAQAWAGGSSRE